MTNIILLALRLSTHPCESPSVEHPDALHYSQPDWAFVYRPTHACDASEHFEELAAAVGIDPWAPVQSDED